jgi:hypothetical protein
LRTTLTRTHTHGLCDTTRSEFPLFLNGHAASEVAAAVDKGGLPASLFAMEDLHQKARGELPRQRTPSGLSSLRQDVS